METKEVVDIVCGQVRIKNDGNSERVLENVEEGVVTGNILCGVWRKEGREEV